MNIFDVTRVESNLTFVYNKRYENPRRPKERKDNRNRLEEEESESPKKVLPKQPTQQRTTLRYDLSKALQQSNNKPDPMLNETALTEAYNSRYNSPNKKNNIDSLTPKLIHQSKLVERSESKSKRPGPVEIKPKPQQLSLYEEDRKPTNLMTITKSFSTISDPNESSYEVKSKKIVFNDSVNEQQLKDVGPQFEDDSNSRMSDFQQSYSAFTSLAKNVRLKYTNVKSPTHQRNQSPGIRIDLRFKDKIYKEANFKIYIYRLFDCIV